MSKIWISGNEAAEILSQRAGRTISANYVRVLASAGKIRSKALDRRTKSYHRGDCEAYHVRQKPLRNQEN